MANINFQEIIQKINKFLNDLPNNIKNAPKDEKIAYGAIGAGIILLIAGSVLLLLL